MTFSLKLNEVSSSIIESVISESKLKGIGPIDLYLGFHPVAISA